jgi:crotonobetainyl-CoA:carnitine CoA-transferase CaiB-like acyl-CoA transferase
MAPDCCSARLWKDYNASKLNRSCGQGGEAIDAFTLTKTKEELYLVGAYERAMLIAPVANTKDISEDIQLEARHFWVDLPHPELERDIPYCGPFIQLSETPIEYRRRAPLIGEHNKEVYAEIGLDGAALEALEAKGII